MSRRTIVVLALLACTLLVVAVAVAVVVDGSEKDTTAHTGATDVAGSFAAALATATPAHAPFAGLTVVRAAIGGRCLRLAVADSEAERVAGLRGNSADLGPYDGMVFVFPGPSQAAFTMAGVTDALDIGFFESDGRRNSTRAMVPCPDKAEAQCPVYRADGAFTFAVETKPGLLPSGPLTACPS
jgi:uncharacterized membrane protein (UPF0127 family)